MLSPRIHAHANLNDLKDIEVSKILIGKPKGAEVLLVGKKWIITSLLYCSRISGCWSTKLQSITSDTNVKVNDRSESTFVPFSVSAVVITEDRNLSEVDEGRSQLMRARCHGV